MDAVVLVIFTIVTNSGCHSDEEKTRKTNVTVKPISVEQELDKKQENLAELKKMVDELKKLMDSQEPVKEEMKAALKEIEKWVEAELKKLKTKNGSSTKKRAYLGIRPGNLNEEEKDELGTGGVKVLELIPDTPAHKAGFEVDDVITECDGQKVESYQDLQKLIHSKKPGDEITLKLLREKEKKDFKVKLATYPDDE